MRRLLRNRRLRHRKHFPNLMHLSSNGTQSKPRCQQKQSELSSMQTADVVIIGGGIVGSSIAWHLTEAGCRNVLVIERESAQGKGSTGKSMGGVRAQFSTPINIEMSLYSIPFYASFEERLGYPCDYRPQGYLFCATNEKHMAYLRANYEKQVAMGLKDV